MKSVMKHHVRPLIALLILLSVGAPAAVTAGDCPMCTTSADCNGGFCVLHNNPVGCGTRVQLCCPGQACAVMNGRPSCEAAGTCTVVSAPSDGGASDVPAATDTPAATDVSGATDGPAVTDVAIGDAGATADGGTITSASSGCACRTGTTTTSSRMGVFALASLALLARRRQVRGDARGRSA